MRLDEVETGRSAFGAMNPLLHFDVDPVHERLVAALHKDDPLRDCVIPITNLGAVPCGGTHVASHRCGCVW